MEPSERLGFERELEIIKKFDNPFIIKYYDNFKYQEKDCIVTEYEKEGSLKDL